MKKVWEWKEKSGNIITNQMRRMGDTVKKGQVLCIIEAMKLMNEIEADVSGVIKAIQVENGQAVEYGQPMFVIG